METIKNYLEAMFASMPNTPEVRKAKDELLSMMEDKYNELIAEGATENAAVGTVISEFGNLDELAESLGLVKEVEEVKEREQEVKSRYVSQNEVMQYLATEAKNAWRIGIGVLLCITCVIYPILADAYFGATASYGAVGMFISIGIAVALFVFSGISRNDWKYFQNERCNIDLNTAESVRNMRRSFKTTHALCHTIGVVLCVTCFVPSIIMDNDLSGAFLFLFVGVGVFLMVYASIVNGSYESVLKINDAKTISGNFGHEGEEKYTNETAEFILSVFWSTVVCIYLSISFLTMYWHITWVIFPIAAVVKKIMRLAWVKEEE